MTRDGNYKSGAEAREQESEKGQGAAGQNEDSFDTSTDDRFMDRLDMISLRTEGTSKAKIADFLSKSSAGRFAIQRVTPNSVLFAFKSGRD